MKLLEYTGLYKEVEEKSLFMICKDASADHQNQFKKFASLLKSAKYVINYDSTGYDGESEKIIIGELIKSDTLKDGSISIVVNPVYSGTGIRRTDKEFVSRFYRKMKMKKGINLTWKAEPTRGVEGEDLIACDKIEFKHDDFLGKQFEKMMSEIESKFKPKNTQANFVVNSNDIWAKVEFSALSKRGKGYDSASIDEQTMYIPSSYGMSDVIYHDFKDDPEDYQKFASKIMKYLYQADELIPEIIEKEKHNWT